MQAPPKLFLNLLYKMEGPHRDEFTVALELTTWDSDTCHEGHITPLPGEDPAHPLHCLQSVPPVGHGSAPRSPSRRAPRPAPPPAPPGTSTWPLRTARCLQPRLRGLDQPVSAPQVPCASG